MKKLLFITDDIATGKSTLANAPSKRCDAIAIYKDKAILIEIDKFMGEQ